MGVRDAGALTVTRDPRFQFTTDACRVFFQTIGSPIRYEVIAVEHKLAGDTFAQRTTPA